MEPLTLAVLLAAAPAADCGPRRMLPQYGYVLEGDTLTLPGGGTHRAEAALLRETYGLVGDGLTLRRTRFVDGCGAPYVVPADARPDTLAKPAGAAEPAPRL